MNIFNQQEQQVFGGQAGRSIAVDRSFLSNVFLWMSFGLLLSAGMAYYFGTNINLLRLLVTETGMTALGWVVMIAPLGFVFAMSLGYQKFSANTLTILFALYAATVGMSLSFLVLIYTSASIFKTFIITAGMFGSMAFMGYTTKTDLTKLGSLLFMALIGLIIAMVVNFFLNSSMFDYIISILGVLIFTGLTAYDVQKLKRLGAELEARGESSQKMVIMGALTLYLDFINLFLFLLRLFGNRK